MPSCNCRQADAMLCFLLSVRRYHSIELQGSFMCNVCCRRCAGTAGTSSAATCAQPRTTQSAWARTLHTSPAATTGPAHTTAAPPAAGGPRQLEGCCSGEAARHSSQQMSRTRLGLSTACRMRLMPSGEWLWCSLLAVQLQGHIWTMPGVDAGLQVLVLSMHQHA